MISVSVDVFYIILMAKTSKTVTQWCSCWTTLECEATLMANLYKALLCPKDFEMCWVESSDGVLGCVGYCIRPWSRDIEGNRELSRSTSWAHEDPIFKPLLDDHRGWCTTQYVWNYHPVWKSLSSTQYSKQMASTIPLNGSMMIQELTIHYSLYIIPWNPLIGFALSTIGWSTN